MSPLDNEHVASRLDEIAELLEVQNDNPWRVRAYRRAAATLRALPRPVAELLEEQGLDGLQALPGIGESLARSIAQLARHDRLAVLDRLRGGCGPAVLETVPGIGPGLARRIADMLHVESLEELEQAAHDGRLAHVPGMGRRRLEGVSQSLAGRLRHAPRPVQGAITEPPPPVRELLDVDREYRERAAAGTLPRIAPRRFNPEGVAWLPVLHTTRGDRHYTALFSNTARAHMLGTTTDWVVIYRDDHGDDGQWTVVTERRGKRKGQRVVRGREGEASASDGPSGDGRHGTGRRDGDLDRGGDGRRRAG